jgi:hypothetical protein
MQTIFVDALGDGNNLLSFFSLLSRPMMMNCPAQYGHANQRKNGSTIHPASALPSSNAQHTLLMKSGNISSFKRASLA